MNKVLGRTLLLTFISIVILCIFRYFKAGSTEKELIFIILFLALLSAIPIILGYILNYSTLESSNNFLIFFKTALLIFNGLLISGTTILSVLILLEDSISVVGFPFIISGCYTYYESIKIYSVAKVSSPASNQDILDDDFI
ncbi:hypothetical protein [Aureispira anguillae]|uniref:Uncharacterized protein n=1 Tax=Aureispira anguillae TaxID=2864201 RepID=A0A915YAZ0_9BACT|nr:hypothetical protein [Aureispira anguillae]BDS09705.1 hypothetical protein AsAng_0004090 [Aureispira anguillae]